ncbi:hypothetical protein F0U60_13485 [Archangium minus]|uniref:Uncharacterized protein n=1 Tax=Archangium minus TaxID=83450 RepID=A0ABY9WMH9_9BACT|nr:hypothetical protein F0U60_13485 [Archangium minus]
MARSAAGKVVIGIIRVLALCGAVLILAIVVLTASSTLMPGTKVRRLFGASPEALAGNADGGVRTMTISEFNERTRAFGDELEADAGTDAGTLAGASDEQRR